MERRILSPEGQNKIDVISFSYFIINEQARISEKQWKIVQNRQNRIKNIGKNALFTNTLFLTII